MLPRKDFTRNISLGLLVGVMGQPQFDWDNLFNLMYPTQFNRLTFFLNDPWNNPQGFYYLKLVNGKYQLNMPNPDWYQHLDRCLERAAYYGGIGINLCFTTAYADTHWRTYHGYGMKLHPFIDNNRGISLDGQNLRKVFENWKKSGFDDNDFEWLAWKADAHDKVTEAHGANPLGQSMYLCGSNIAEMCGKHKHMTPLRANYWIRAFNEPDCTIDSKGHVVDGVDADPRVENWLLKEFTDAGFEEARKFRLLRGGLVKNQNPPTPNNPLSVDFVQMRKNINFCAVRKQLYEVHGSYDWMLEGLEHAGAIMSAVNASFDGVKDDQVVTEAKKALARPEIKNIDIKLPDPIVDGGWNVNDMNYNVNHGFMNLVKALNLD